jgi:hypothetical protein
MSPGDLIMAELDEEGQAALELIQSFVPYASKTTWDGPNERGFVVIHAYPPGRAPERYQVSPVLMEKAIEYLRTKAWPIGGLKPPRLGAKVLPWESSRKYRKA